MLLKTGMPNCGSIVHALSAFKLIVGSTKKQWLKSVQIDVDDHTYHPTNQQVINQPHDRQPMPHTNAAVAHANHLVAACDARCPYRTNASIIYRLVARPLSALNDRACLKVVLSQRPARRKPVHCRLCSEPRQDGPQQVSWHDDCVLVQAVGSKSHLGPKCIVQGDCPVRQGCGAGPGMATQASGTSWGVGIHLDCGWEDDSHAQACMALVARALLHCALEHAVCIVAKGWVIACKQRSVQILIRECEQGLPNGVDLQFRSVCTLFYAVGCGPIQVLQICETHHPCDEGMCTCGVGNVCITHDEPCVIWQIGGYVSTCSMECIL